MNETLDRFGCLNNTIKVAAGHYVDLANPDPATIEIESIAAALSKVCRFGGHCPQFYSVAEHCIHATALASKDGYGGDVLTSILLHDASEAYIGDMVKPLKVAIPQYSEVEDRMEAAIESAFGIQFEKFKGLIKLFDRMMLKAEKIAMWPEDTEKWEGFADIKTREVKFQFWGPSEAEYQFIKFANALGLIV